MTAGTALVARRADQALAGPLGSLDAYLERVSRIPVLSREEERALAERFRATADLDAARQLVLSHLRFVVHIARGYSGYGLPLSDLVQEGNIGLMKAVKRFDPNVGVRLVSFAVHWIRAEIHEYVLRNWRLVKVATTKAQRKLFFNLRSMKQHAGAMSREEIEGVARELSVKPEEVAEMETRMSGADVALEARADDGSEEFSPIHYLTDASGEPDAVIERRSYDRLQGEGIQEALASLDPRSRRVIEARWLDEDSDGSVGTATLHELASEFGVSAERIRQIEAKALRRMRGALAGYA